MTISSESRLEDTALDDVVENKKSSPASLAACVAVIGGLLLVLYAPVFASMFPAAAAGIRSLF